MKLLEDYGTYILIELKGNGIRDLRQELRFETN